MRVALREICVRLSVAIIRVNYDRCTVVRVNNRRVIGFELCRVAVQGNVTLFINRFLCAYLSTLDRVSDGDLVNQDGANVIAVDVRRFLCSQATRGVDRIAGLVFPVL